MADHAYSHARTFYRYVVISTVALALAVLSGAAIGLWERAVLLPSYIFFFSFAAFSVMLFQTILTRRPDQLPALDLREQQVLLVITLTVSGLSVVSELALIPWLKILAGLLLGGAVLEHGRRVWTGYTVREIWGHSAYRYFVTDMLFLLVAAVGLFAGERARKGELPAPLGVARPPLHLGAARREGGFVYKIPGRHRPGDRFGRFARQVALGEGAGLLGPGAPGVGDEKRLTLPVAVAPLGGQPRILHQPCLGALARLPDPEVQERADQGRVGQCGAHRQRRQQCGRRGHRAEHEHPGSGSAIRHQSAEAGR